MKTKSILALLAVFMMAFMAFNFLTPSAPTLKSPENGATEVSTAPMLQWNAVSEIGCNITYRVQVDNDQDFSSITLERSNLSSTSYTVTSEGEPALNNNVTYYWRVSATSSGINCQNPGESNWSQVWHFTTRN